MSSFSNVSSSPSFWKWAIYTFPFSNNFYQWLFYCLQSSIHLHEEIQRYDLFFSHSNAVLQDIHHNFFWMQPGIDLRNSRKTKNERHMCVCVYIYMQWSIDDNCIAQELAYVCVFLSLSLCLIFLPLEEKTLSLRNDVHINWKRNCLYQQCTTVGRLSFWV